MSLFAGVSVRRFLIGAALLSGMVSCAPREKFDLDQIRERGTLRIIAPRLPERPFLPRTGYPVDYGRILAEQYARSLDLEPEIVWVNSRADLIPSLLRGNGDIVAANLTVTAGRQEDIVFSAPVDEVREQLVTRIGDTTLLSLDSLAGRTIAVRRSSSYWETAQQLAREHPGLAVDEVSERLDTEEILFRVASGRYDLTIADNNIVDQALGYMPELRIAFDVGGSKDLAWAIRPDAPLLKTAVDSFLVHDAVRPIREPRLMGDLDSIRARGVLRVLTTNSAATYFVWRGELMGFEYDLASEFARRLGVQLEIVVPPNRANLISWLRQGYGDLIAAGLTPTAERVAGGLAFSRPYNFAIKTVVGRADERDIDSPADLEGRTLTVRRRSSYWDAAQLLADRGTGVRIEPAPGALETEEVIDSVADGGYDLTIADSHVLDIELAWRDDIRALFTVGDTVPHAWAMREGDSQLQNAVNSFIRSVYRGRWYNITRNRYFRRPELMQERVTERVAVTGEISSYDDLFKQYAVEFGLDWRLLAAQSFAESRFNPEARSSMGAVGLMQLMPQTASAFGFHNPEDPDEAVNMGALYLRRQIDLFAPTVETAEDRLWFGLASYNAGFGHVGDARRLASMHGKDPNKWFGEVEDVMPMLARSEYHAGSRYGYCRCSEPVHYVRKIRDTFAAYRQLMPIE